MFFYILAIPLVFVYTIGIDAFLYDNYDIPPVTNFLGAQPPDTIAIDGNVCPRSGDMRLTTRRDLKGFEKKRIYVFTGEMAIYMFIHAVLSFVPGYITFICLCRIFYGFVEILRILIQTGSHGYQNAILIAEYVMKFLRIGNAVIDSINRITSKYHRLKKTAESLITYSLVPVCLIGVALFYLCKKLFTKKDDTYPQPHTRNTESRNQAMINLGIMIVAFIGWSDLGLWKRFQDWIRMTEYVNRIFGDSALDTSCKNFNPNKYNPNCRGTRKGDNTCLTCTATQLPKDPALASRINLDFSMKSIMDNPGVYFYPLVNSLVFNYDKAITARIPEWYTRLPHFLQEQIFDSHYAQISDVDSFPRAFRLNHTKLMAGEFILRRDEKIGKWTIITAETDAAMERLRQPQNSKPHIFKTYDNQYVPTDSDSDSEDYQISRRAKTHVENSEIKESKDIAEPHTFNKDQALNELEHYYADAFMFDDDEKVDATEAIPLLQQLPQALKSYYRPCLFIAAMCLILYGTFYRFRKHRQAQENEQLKNKVADAVAQKMIDFAQDQDDIPPVLKMGDHVIEPQPESYQPGTNKLQLDPDSFKRVDPETYQSRMKDLGKKNRREEPKHNRKHPERDQDTSDFTLSGKQVYDKIKKEKQRTYIVYNLDDLHKLFSTTGIFMIGPDGTGKTVKSREEFEFLKSSGYQIDPQDLHKIKQATVDLSKLEEKDPIDFNSLREVIKKNDLTTRKYRYLVDLLDDGMNPDPHWMATFNRYEYNRESNIYNYVAPETHEVAKQILKKEIRKADEIKKQNDELSSPITTTPEQYEKYKELITDFVAMTNNPKLEKELNDLLTSTVVADSETNIATVKSRVCPFGSSCKLHDCILQHDDAPQSEALLGPVKIDHYPLNMDTQNVYKIYLGESTDYHHGMCNHTRLGFITNHHTFFYDKAKTRPIEPCLLQVLIDGKRYPIKGFERFPEINGNNAKPLADSFQDLVVFQLNQNLNLKCDKGKPPRDGERIVVVSGNQLSAKAYADLPPEKRSSTRTQEAILHAQPNGLFYFKSNNQPGDSGSAIYSLDQNWAYIGTYFGRANRDYNTLIPVDPRYLPNINGGVSFKLSKNSQPTV